MSSNAKETEIKIKAIQTDRETILAHYHELKLEMMKTREKERKNLTELTIQSEACLDTLLQQKDKVTQFVLAS
jgi:hypothetical protein